MAGLTSEPRRAYHTRLLGRQWLSEFAFRLELERPEGFRFQAGQSIRLIESEIERDYSIASGPFDAPLAICVRLVASGRLSGALAAAPLGAKLRFAGPGGFFIPQASARPSVFVATGVGVSPFLSMLRAGAAGFTVLHGVRSRAELYYEKELRAAASRYVACVTAGAGEGQFPGRVTDWAAQNLSAGCYDFYLCGNRHMVRDFTLLADARFPGSRVFTEVFH